LAAMSGSSYRRQLDGGIIPKRSDIIQARVAGALDGPFVVLFEEQGADEANGGSLVGEDADDVLASLDLAIETLEWVG